MTSKHKKLKGTQIFCCRCGILTCVWVSDTWDIKLNAKKLMCVNCVNLINESNKKKIYFRNNGIDIIKMYEDERTRMVKKLFEYGVKSW